MYIIIREKVTEYTLFYLVFAVIAWTCSTVNLKQKVQRNNITRFGAWVLGLMLCAFLLVEAFIIMGGIDENVQGANTMLIFGASLLNSDVSPALRERLDKGLEILNANPAMVVVVSGGLTKPETITEAEGMRQYLVAHGIDEKRIYKEQSATSTYENLVYSKTILKQLEIPVNAPIVMVSNDFHMARIKLLAGRVGLNARIVSAKTPLIDYPQYILREYFAMVKSVCVDK
ncbi:MAG: YdcF family protein [Hyphomonadaceae bacterium]|nr:YdcF family protein [Clostridia bacterium]